MPQTEMTRPQRAYFGPQTFIVSSAYLLSSADLSQGGQATLGLFSMYFVAKNLVSVAKTPTSLRDQRIGSYDYYRFSEHFTSLSDAYFPSSCSPSDIVPMSALKLPLGSAYSLLSQYHPHRRAKRRIRTFNTPWFGLVRHQYQQHTCSRDAHHSPSVIHMMLPAVASPVDSYIESWLTDLVSSDLFVHFFYLFIISVVIFILRKLFFYSYLPSVPNHSHFEARPINRAKCHISELVFDSYLLSLLK